ncbi:hypothetical protein [Umezawaea sp. NPDC059074]|uniref:hypothetical protein n=1 Tax=Umezawaea sp. NPDC059074 TaxID=3346716 RepID=UPI0036C535AD
MAGPVRVDLTAEGRSTAPRRGWSAGLVGRADARSAEVELRLPALFDALRLALRLAVTAPETSEVHRLARTVVELLGPAGEWTEPDWRLRLVSADVTAFCRATGEPVARAVRELLAALPREEGRR